MTFLEPGLHLTSSGSVLNPEGDEAAAPRGSAGLRLSGDVSSLCLSDQGHG